MTDILTETVAPEDLKKYEAVYHEQLYKNNVTSQVQFDYAYCLVRSKYASDIQKGIILFEDLYKRYKDGQRDYLYYLAIGYARIKEYSKALKYVRMFLAKEPGNQQMVGLEETIKKQMEKEGLKGMAVAGAVVLGVGAIVGVGIALAKGGKGT